MDLYNLRKNKLEEVDRVNFKLEKEIQTLVEDNVETTIAPRGEETKNFVSNQFGGTVSTAVEENIDFLDEDESSGTTAGGVAEDSDGEDEDEMESLGVTVTASNFTNYLKKIRYKLEMDPVNSGVTKEYPVTPEVEILLYFIREV